MQARKESLFSYTHPETNNATVEEKKIRKETIDKFRQSCEGVPASLHYIRHKIKKYQMANCGEYGYLALSHLIDAKKNRDIRIEFVAFENDDHTFIVLDRSENSMINDLSTWGDNAVIVDAWMGEVYAASKNEPSKN